MPASASTASSLLSFTALRQDFRFARRMLVKSPLFTTIVVLTLAIGIGLNTAVFAAVDAMLLRPLPGVRDASALMQIYRTSPGGQLYGSSSFLHYYDIRDRSKSVFSGVVVWSFQFANVTADGPPKTVAVQMVSGNYFNVLGVTPIKGRVFADDEDVGAGAHPIVVLGEGTWKTMFASDPNIVGRSIPVNGQAYTIVGVVPASFNGTLPMVHPAFWVPYSQVAQIKPGSSGDLQNRGNNYNNIIARLKPNVTPEQARERLHGIDRELLAEYPNEYKDRGSNLVRQADAGVHPMFRAAQVGLSAVVMIVVGILLIIACVNVANLFLARARDRAREMAIRLALGSQRGALIRQLLVESLLFALIAGVAGMIVAVWAIGIANRITLPFPVDFRPDLQLSPIVLTFAVAITAFTGMLFGIVPALQATRPSLIPALKGEAPAGESRSRTTKGLVVAQMALSMVLLTCAALFLLNLRGITALDKGFDGENILLADLDPGLQGYPRSRSNDFFRQLLEQLRANPMVKDAAIIDVPPLSPNSSDRGVTIPGYVPQPNEGMSILYGRTSPGYMHMMGIGIREGREFAAQDDSAAQLGIVVNEQFATHFWPNQSALGHIVRAGARDFTVIGVVTTGKYRRLGEEPTAFMYFAQQQSWTSSMTLMIRTNGDPVSLIPQLRKLVGAFDPNLPVTNVRTMEEHLGYSLLPARVAGSALGVFGVLGLLLASVGMYGVMAYSVSQRTREIGIRMAIGATAADVVRLIMRQGLTLVLIGTVIGFVGALGAAKMLGSVLYGGSGFDLSSFVGVPLVLIAVSALATFVPARRAALVDPAISIRTD